MTTEHWGLEFEGDDTAVTIFRDGKPVTTGRGSGRAEALHAAWISLQQLKEEDLAFWVALKYRKLTGSDPAPATP